MRLYEYSAAMRGSLRNVGETLGTDLSRVREPQLKLRMRLCDRAYRQLLASERWNLIESNTGKRTETYGVINSLADVARAFGVFRNKEGTALR